VPAAESGQRGAGFRLPGGTLGPAVTPDDETQTIVPAAGLAGRHHQIPRVTDAAPPVDCRRQPGRGGEEDRALPPSASAASAPAGLGLLMLSTVGFIVILVAYSRISIPNPNDSAIRQTTRVYYSGGSVESAASVTSTASAVTWTRCRSRWRDAVLAAEKPQLLLRQRHLAQGHYSRAVGEPRGGSAQQGGSTITQQYVKDYYLTPARTFKTQDP